MYFFISDKNLFSANKANANIIIKEITMFLFQGV